MKLYFFLVCSVTVLRVFIYIYYNNIYDKRFCCPFLENGEYHSSFQFTMIFSTYIPIAIGYVYHH